MGEKQLKEHEVTLLTGLGSCRSFGACVGVGEGDLDFEGAS